MNNNAVWRLFFPKGCISGVCSHLSPAAISPLRARARFAGSLLIGFDSFHAVVGGVSIFILTHNNTPLGPTSTGTGTLNTADISQQVNPYLDLHLRDTKSSWLKGQRQMWQKPFSSHPQWTESNPENLPSVGLFKVHVLATPGGQKHGFPLEQVRSQQVFHQCLMSDHVLGFPKLSYSTFASLRGTDVLTDTTVYWEILFFAKLQALI